MGPFTSEGLCVLGPQRKGSRDLTTTPWARFRIGRKSIVRSLAV